MRNSIKHMVPPGYSYTKTFIRMLAVVMNMKLMYFGKQFGRYFLVKKPMHQCVNDKACIKPGKNQYPVFKEEAKYYQQDIDNEKEKSLQPGYFNFGGVVMV